MIDNLVFWFAAIATAVLILILGWQQPLRYRFMSRAEIYQLEHPAGPTPWMWNSTRKTMLDRGAYGESTSTSRSFGTTSPTSR